MPEYSIDDLRNISYFMNALQKASNEFGIFIAEGVDLWNDQGEILGTLIDSDGYKFSSE